MARSWHSSWQQGSGRAARSNIVLGELCVVCGTDLGFDAYMRPSGGCQGLAECAGLAAVPVGRGGAWPGFETTHQAHASTPGPTGVEGAGGTGGHGRASRRGAEQSEAA